MPVICLLTVLILLPAAALAQSLPGTAPLTWTDDLSVRMMDGAHRFAERKIAESAVARQRHWRRDFASRERYEESVAANRRRFREKTGVVDSRVPAAMERFGGDDTPTAAAAETSAWRTSRVRWPVLEGVHGEGLLLEPRRPPAACAVVLPDAGQSPEQAAGLAPGLPPWSQTARLLAEAGFLVVVPVLIDRESRWSGREDIQWTGQPHREWIYRQAFHMGRHVIGYEMQKVLAAVDWMQARAPRARIGVAGYAEGGLIAFYAAAADPRIDAALVSGYFDSRQRVWSEPIYRNVWGLLEEFGDAELASLIAPRGLVIEFASPPEVKSSKGDIVALEFDSVRREFERIGTLVPEGFQNRALISSGPADAVRRFASLLGVARFRIGPQKPPRAGIVPDAGRQRRQVKELESHVQNLVRESERVRERFFLLKAEPRFADQRWSTRVRHETIEPGPFIEAARAYRERFWKEAMGRFEDPMLPPNPRTRKVYDTEKWTGHEVVLDVWPDVFAWGVLLVPKGIRPGERRPVVVCQHGRNGLPKDVIEVAGNAYDRFAARLAAEGFVVFAPHNLYRGEDRYRWLDRKANAVKASLFSFIIAQHDQLLRWLETLPFVDGARMAFYGLSYGGETAMRAPAVLEKYALSICSGDFNQWTTKVASTHESFSFMYTIEWEMPYFNLGGTFDYAEMAYLIFPRPFLVERGHHDRVGRDRWVAYEYAKVRWLYAQFGLADRTEIEYFQGGHAIHGRRAFEFLREHLGWPE